MFLEEIGRIAKIFKSLIKEKRVRIFSHLDADGICSASIISKTLIREGTNFELKILKQLTREEIKNLRIRESDFLVLTDFGSGQLDLLRDLLDRAQVLVIDHHESKAIEHLNLFHLNPLIFNEEEISSSMVSYLFAKSVDIKNADLIDLAIVGAVADEQDEKWEFRGLAKRILEEAETIGKIVVTKGLRLYGRITKPIHKTLEHSFDPIIPGISGSESNAVQFLSELGIAVREDDEWKRLKDLTLEEQKTLASAIIIERLRSKHSDAEDIFGDIYTISGRPEELQDAREFATFLNACGRFGKADIGIRICLGDLEAVSDALCVLEEYRKLIGEIINWIRENEAILTKDFGVYLFGKNFIPETLIGTITSILLNSNLIDTNKPIFGFAETDSGEVKVSARVSRDFKLINLGKIVSDASRQVEGEGGGHVSSAGALIPKGKEDKFVQAIEDMLGETFGKRER
ncbi:MAG: DHH family phosphoesterase [Candidatus Aenigmarchaeota archaeon]|nr:DHH family phosphoesterase [Candidatus Aenigmarchaeota archaeon]